MDATKIKTIPAYVHFDGVDLGSTSSPIEFLLEGKFKDITADQFADEVLAKINQGVDVKVKATFQEIDEALLEQIYGAAALATPYTGGSCSDPQYTDQATCELNTEVWTAKTKVLGFGTAKVGTNIASTAKPLRVIPLSTAEKDMQLYFWKAYPVPGGLKYSGNDQNEVEIEFSIIADETKPAEISKGILGDPTDYIA